VPELQPAYYVPCFTDAQGSLRVALRETRDGRVALIVYSALDRLRAGAGDVPWAFLTLADLQAVRDESPFEVIYQDIRVPEDKRQVAG
jgi:hypothetical protein